MFHSIKAKNFLSWKDLEFDIISGITLITAWNYDDNTKEGSGKSAIFNALCWGLYGKIPKDVLIDDVITDGESYCSVEIILDNGNSIVRTRNPNDLYVKYTTGRAYREKDIRGTQRYIDKEIGLTFDTFCSAVYFSQSGLNRFLSSKEDLKVKILSELQNLAVYDRARKRTHDKLLDLEKTKSEFMNARKTTQNQLQLLKESKAKLMHVKLNRKKELADKVNQLKEKLGEAEEKIKKLEGSLDSRNFEAEIDSLKKDQEEVHREQSMFLLDLGLYEKEQINKKVIDTKIEQAKNRLTHKKKELDFLYQAKEKVCPTCGTTVTSDKAQNILEKELSTYNCMVEEYNQLVEESRKINIKDFNELKAKVADCKLVLHKLQFAIRELETKEKQNLINKQIIQNLRNNILQLHKDIDSEKNRDTKDIDEQLEKTEEELINTAIILDKIKVETSTLEEELVRYSILKIGFKEIKQYIFQDILNTLNYKTNRVLGELFDIPIELAFKNVDEEGEISKITTEVTIGGTTRGVGLLSGGQYKRCELAVDLALAEIVQERTNKVINFRVFDEPFTGLSFESVQKAVKLFEKLEGSTVLIDHAAEVKSIVDNVIQIEYRNKQSKFME